MKNKYEINFDAVDKRIFPKLLKYFRENNLEYAYRELSQTHFELVYFFSEDKYREILLSLK